VIEANAVRKHNLYKYQKYILITITFTWVERFKFKKWETGIILKESYHFYFLNLKPHWGLPILPHLLRQMPSRIVNYSGTTSSL
jgi:hypothetical protein